MEKMYVVFADIENEGRWFYGLYSMERAYEVADELNSYVDLDADYCYLVCAWDEVEDMEIRNLPDYFYAKRGY